MDFVDYQICPKGNNEHKRLEWEAEQLAEMYEETTDFSKVDYIIDKCPLSAAMVRTVEQGIDWYQTNHPELPDEVIEIAARAQWGIREQQPARTKKTDAEKPIFSIEHKEVSVDLS